MGKFRLLSEGRGFYHTTTRCVDRKYFFREPEVKEEIRNIFKKLEIFLNVDITAHCIMCNHYHLLLDVPDPKTVEPLTVDSLLELLPILYDNAEVESVRQQLLAAGKGAKSKKSENDAVRKILARYEARRGNLSNFMKELNQRITNYINRREDRTGTLWEEPYESVWVEDTQSVLLATAAYIDLNPVRAGIVEKPEDYRWSSYGEALGGCRRARKAMARMLSEALLDEDFKSDWRRTHNRYRVILFIEGQEVEANPDKGDPGRRGISEAEVEKVVEADGEMSLPEVLRHRVRYFTAGVLIGSASFINRIFERDKKRFGPKRTSGARKMRGADWGDLRTLRDLQVNVIE